MNVERAKTAAWDLKLPEPPSALLPSHLRNAPLWIDFIHEIEQETLHYRQHFDSPEKRLREKNPERFRLD